MMGIAAGAALIAAGASAVTLTVAQPVNTTDRAAIEKIVREYILAHPEILPEAMENLRAKEVEKALSASRAALETPVGDAWQGAADGDVTLVQFFDYACGYCRASMADINRLLAEDPRLRVVYRDMPVLGDDSLEAARLSVAAALSGKFNAMHAPLYAAGRPSAASREAVRRRIGLDAKAIAAPDVDREIARNLQFQREFDISGTPAWVVGNKLLVGAVGYDALKAAIAEARAARGQR